ncbi:hypothetical protein [Kitasatospora mediocidica]|uniref:hypothetical protein n=1 Tax=Kitasatospora mediocidica TaxID=58352 RepID=UPI0005602B5D|nr:hypothetical protein [Kitasatospora mediocidica]
MTEVVVAVVLLALIAAATYLALGKHLAPPAAAQPAGRPFGAVAPTLWRHCPRCARAEYVLAPGGTIPPCPCLTIGEPT